MRRKLGSVSAVVLAALSLVLLVGSQPASAAGTAQSSIPTALPAGFTPNIVDGTDSSGNSYRVFDMAQVGNMIVVGGVFAQVRNVPPNGTTLYNRTSIFAFNKDTGAVSATFAPTLDGVVNAVAAGPDNTVLIGGKFSTVNGVNSKNFAVLDINTGARVATTPVFNGVVQDVKVFGNRVFVGGTFTAAGGAAHAGLATLNLTTWAIDPYMNLQVSGHHNYGVNPVSVKNGVPTWGAQGAVGVNALDLSPDGSQMVIIGNFTSVSGAYRDQVAKILLHSTGPVVDPNWATSGYHAPCKVKAFDSYIRSVQWSPDGTYFVITATGAPYSGTLCDTAARWNASDTGSAVNPAWVASTGGDSLWSVAVTGTAIYVGGHERWLNNALGSDSAKPGAVPRPGMAALDPLSGVPLTWNPGRNPRGIGAGAMLATPDGVYVGMDTDYIGNFKYRHQKIAFFPLAGGTAPVSQDTGTLPGTVFLAGGTRTAGADAVVSRSFNGSTAGTDSTLSNNGGISWSKSRGAFMAGNTLFYGYPDAGGTYEVARQTFNGSTFGSRDFGIKGDPAHSPYHDPTWMTVQTGSGQTYDGSFPNFYGAELKSVTGMFYWNGRLYYAKTGTGALLYRNFSVDSDIVAPTSTQVASSGFANAGGFILDQAHGLLYMADRTNGNLLSMSFANGVPGTTQNVVSGPNKDGKDWRTTSLFLLPTPSTTPSANQPPSAVITSATCPSGQTCSFDASGSRDPDGDALSYTWKFGDNQSATVTTPTTTHTYASSGNVTVQLTVTDGRGGTSSTSASLTVPPNPTQQGIAFRAAADAATPKGGSSVSLTVPAAVQPGDGLILVLSTNSAVTGTAPGFTQVALQTVPTSASNPTPQMTTQVFQKTATSGDAGQKLTVTLSGGAKTTLQLVAYSGTAAGGPIRTATGAGENGSTSHATPAGTASQGDWVLSVWSDKGSNARSWSLPGGEVQRSNLGAGGLASEIASLAADGGAPVAAAGPVAGISASVPAGDAKATMFTIVIAGS